MEVEKQAAAGSYPLDLERRINRDGSGVALALDESNGARSGVGGAAKPVAQSYNRDSKDERKLHAWTTAVLSS